MPPFQGGRRGFESRHPLQKIRSFYGSSYKRKHQYFMVRNLRSSESVCERVKGVYDEIEERRIKDVFNAILKCNLQPETIICSDCGNVYSIKDKKTFPL